jgi:micrococcal nuclease
MAALLRRGTLVRLERDVEARDRYDRLLAYVVRAEDGLFVNERLVEEGFAESIAYPPNTARQAELDRAETEARDAQRGLWAACGGTDVPLAPG